MTTRTPVTVLSMLVAMSMAMLVLPTIAAPQPITNQATVTVDTNTASQGFDPMIFGGFLEHFDNQIYGGVKAQPTYRPTR